MHNNTVSFGAEISNLLKSATFSGSTDATHLYNLPGSSIALLLALREEPFIAVEDTDEAALRLYEDIQFFLGLSDNPSGKIHFLPEPDGPEASGKRAEVAYHIGKKDSIVTSTSGMTAPIWRSDELKSTSLFFAPGREMEREFAERGLRNLGYRRVSVVMEEGEYSMRGWLIDIFPPMAEYPVRIEFFGDEIEKIRSFDIDSQRSVSAIEDLVVLPAIDPSRGEGISSTFAGTKIFIDCKQPEPPSAVGTDLKSVPIGGDELSLSRYDFKGEGHDAGFLPIKGLGIYPDERRSLNDIADSIRILGRDNKIIIVSSSEGQAERMKDILFEGGVIAPLIDKKELLAYEGPVAITKGKLSAGFYIPGILALTEKEIFGERPPYRAMKKSKVSQLLLSMDDIAPGDFVVHRDHGIGRFIGIEKQIVGSIETDLIVLEYSGKDRLYIPLYNIDRIKKYGAEEGVAPALDKLGGRTWDRRREKVRKAVKEMAERLLKLYAEREVANSFSFSPDTEIHREFYEFFPYEETPDQIRTIEEISRDMESDRPMDRLLCGDVGYGKTEVAMRAVFKAIYDGKQVAVLVPTTILCEQHHETFKSRFSGFPVKIDYLSRFKPKREQGLTIKALAKGEVDIVIGTHGLLRKDISFCDLGLLVIDEEHRFGVGQKERIKELKKGVDVLSMTATPIPRTLQMAISGIRGMSVIETPPEERLTVRNIVSVFDEELIREAVQRELHRGGQVLFVHNFVFDIEKMAGLLKKLLPGVRFGIGHGQMPEKRLEQVMMDFVKKEIDVLVSTNIIGSGIDIPTANTIIINRADKIGLSDLYQLRGRVGRSNVRAFAYFLIPGKDIISEEAKKRLKAISEMSYLGAGFRLAMKDLEMRGAGNLLGAEQSGHIHAVGFDMYIEMLEKAVAELKGDAVKEGIEPSVSLNVSALIPESYVEDMALRLGIYRRIANARDIGQIEDIGSEMADRFGSLPGEVKSLLDIMVLKILARRLFITGISQTGGRVRFVFSDETPVKVERLFELRKIFQGIKFHKDGFELVAKSPSADDIYDQVHRALSILNEAPSLLV